MLRPLAVSALVSGVLALSAQAADIPLSQVPAPALAAVKKQFPAAKLVEASKDTVDGEVEYTVTLTHKKDTYEVTVTGDGKILEIAREMTLKELPKAVGAAFHKQYPKAKVQGVWELTVPGMSAKKYQIECLTAAGKDVTAEFDSSGRLLSEE